MDANAYLAEMRRIVDTYNAQVQQTQGPNRQFDDVGELQAAKRVNADAVRELRSLKQRVVQSEREVQAAYQAASAQAGAKDHFVLQMLGGRKAAGRARADNKRAISTNKAQALAPYRELKLRIDDAIRELSQIGSNLSSAITQEKTTAPKRTGRTSGGTLSKQLAELAELHRTGALSDHEFAAAKAKLLGQ